MKKLFLTILLVVIPSWVFSQAFGHGGFWIRIGNNIHYTTGNVGILTSTPDAPLHIGESGGTSGQIRFEASDGDVGDLTMTTADQLNFVGFTLVDIQTNLRLNGSNVEFRNNGGVLEFISNGGFVLSFDGTNALFRNNVIILQDVNAGLTAGTTQTQAAGLDLTAQVNEVSIVANTSDTVVLPLLPAAGSMMVTIVNNGANTMRVFPGVGDDLGAGANTADAVNIPTATTRIYISYDATNWEKYLSE